MGYVWGVSSRHGLSVSTVARCRVLDGLVVGSRKGKVTRGEVSMIYIGFNCLYVFWVESQEWRDLWYLECRGSFWGCKGCSFGVSSL